VPTDAHWVDDDDLADEEVYEFAPGEEESAGAVTLPDGRVIRPDSVVDANGDAS
jgi:hypothetical protein